MAQVNPFVFIVGCPRSGTTLLQRLVDAHPQMAVTPETHWIPRWFKQAHGLTADGFVTSDLLSDALSDPRFVRLQVGLEDLEAMVAAGSSVDYATFVSYVFDRYGEQRAKSLVGDKTPAYVRRLPLLHRLWPTAKFVHVIRDGRDVSVSLMSWNKGDRILGRFKTWAEDRVSTAGLFWEWHVRLGRKAGRELGPGLYREIRYEALVSSTEQVCTELCDFLGVAFDERMLAYHYGRARPDSGLDAKHAWLPPTPGLRDWRSEMSGDDIERFESVAGPLLAELGYERANSRPSREPQAHASRIRALFLEDSGRLFDEDLVLPVEKPFPRRGRATA